MDYAEEQKSEIEALESIYPAEFSIISSEEPSLQFSIEIKSDVPNEIQVSCQLCFTYVPNYPDEVPVIEIEEPENLSDEDVISLKEILEKLASESLGMVMIFTLVSAGQEWLNQHIEQIEIRMAEEQERRKKEAEEAEMRKFVGTRVSVESFIEWKVKFDEEMALLKKKKKEAETDPKKLTGRELFERDTSLIESEMKFLQEGEEEIQVDESLFEELDALQLEEELAAESDEENEFTM